jgi:cell division protein ZapA
VKDAKTDSDPITINILEKEFRIACPPEEKDALLASARYLSEKMREVRDTGKVIGMDRISIMAGLNISHELLQQKNRADKLDGVVSPRLASLQRRVEQLLNGHRNQKN